MNGIHQFVPMLHQGDAVGRHTTEVRNRLVARGINSRIFVELTDPATTGETAPYGDYAAVAQPGDVLVYQQATASDMAPWLAGRPETLVVNYHNITPPECFASWDNRLARHQVRARSEVGLLAHRAALGVAVSAYNEAELRAAGYTRTAVVPPAATLLNSGITAAPIRDTPKAEGARWLCVGRLAPNKAVHHAVMALLVTRQHDDPSSTLTVVGSPVVPAYTEAIHAFVADLGLADAVTFRGHVNDAALAHLFAQSDVLVVTSEHEGFGVPVLEALALGCPVVANRAGALPEIVGEAGRLVNTSDPWQLSRAVVDLLADEDGRQARVDTGRAHVASYHLDGAADRLIDLLVSLP
jgi:glycosyltransferase involved in cell wall biosynthesis